MSRGPVSLSLLGAVLRTTKIAPLLVTSSISVAFLVIPLLIGLRNGLREFDVSAIFHLSLIVSLAGASFVLDDPAHETLSVTVIGRAQVAVVRMAAGSVVLIPVWAIQLALAPQLIESSKQFPVRGLAIEGPILVICIWAVCALFLKRFDGHASTVGVPAALIGCAAVFLLPESVALFENPANPGFTQSRVRFAFMGVAGLALLIHGLRSRKYVRRPAQGTAGPNGPSVRQDSPSIEVPIAKGRRRGARNMF